MFPACISRGLPASLAAAFLVWGHAVSAGADVISADMSEGYGAEVMDIILANWTRPVAAEGSTSVIVRITNDGRPFSCELRKSSGNTQVDDAICMAVAKAGAFPPAPYGVPAVVALTFRYDSVQKTGTADAAVTASDSQSYTDMIMESARPHLMVPDTLHGEFHATVRLTILPDGTLAEYKVETSSGEPVFDTAVLRALLQPSVITPPPGGKEQTVFLTFSLSR